MARCTCTGCGRVFGSLSAFDAHRVGKFAKPGRRSERRCMTDEEMDLSRLASDAGGVFRGAPGAWQGREAIVDSGPAREA